MRQLTHLLQYSLGGNSKTLMFVMVSPLQAHLSETLTSLKFATKVRLISFAQGERGSPPTLLTVCSRCTTRTSGPRRSRQGFANEVDIAYLRFFLTKARRLGKGRLVGGHVEAAPCTGMRSPRLWQLALWPSQPVEALLLLPVGSPCSSDHLVPPSGSSLFGASTEARSTSCMYDGQFEICSTLPLQVHDARASLTWPCISGVPSCI